MASITQVLSQLLLPISLFLLLHLPYRCIALKPLEACKFNAIYQLGDSLSDTGNLIIENPAFPSSKLPYGETFFKKPTGRCSDGLLIIDYFALAAGIPLLDPYLNKGALFGKGRGVNFAVAGSTALPVNVLAQMNISSPFTNISLNLQLDWMDTHFESICLNAKDCENKLKSSLFIVGEIGGNDYDFGLFLGKKTIKEAMNMVPQVVQAIKDAVQKILAYGAPRVIVPGNFPNGCLPYYLTAFQTNDSSAYNEYHCLKGFNELSIYHNDHLQKAIEELKEEHPNATILYGDYYSAFLWVLHHASNLGFDTSSLQKSCCGIGGDYNFSSAKICGASGVPVCSNPDQHISWDGIHLTQKTHNYMSAWLIRNLLPQLGCGV
ncbi:GDSL esterase/lipase At5g03980-like [Ziziphus jujuba]|uniref:GDSL esterase/lipase At5g03980-like n=1 Tax=Ziziphus jujuba TaxID=326968 RepID=A0A6P3ZIZ6_ZIZJJ|nr:GDSL esterase/lipase At5g03980-like [Ziziphus jujuba]